MTVQTAPPLLLAAVVAFALLEFVWRKRSGRGYDLAALGGTLGVAAGQIVSRALGGAVIAAALLAIYAAAPAQWPLDDWRTWAVGFVAVEFCYYWQHRFNHTVRWFWATHAVHHSTNQFTLPAAMRLGWTGAISGSWVAYAPLALAGFHPALIGGMVLISLRYQYFLHTEAVGRLGVLEWVFNTPSHHRVHHGSNAAYLDKNFGGVLIVFDRLFGTFAAERADAPVVYGLTRPLRSHNPFVIAFHEWGRLVRDLRRAPSFMAAVRTMLGRPGAGQPFVPSSTSHSNQQRDAVRASGG